MSRVYRNICNIVYYSLCWWYGIITRERKWYAREFDMVFERYCERWKLSMNTSKTKVVVFSKKKTILNHKVKLYGKDIDIVNTYSYLSVLYCYNGSFHKAKKRLWKALYALYAKIKKISNSVVCIWSFGFRQNGKNSFIIL